MALRTVHDVYEDHGVSDLAVAVVLRHERGKVHEQPGHHADAHDEVHLEVEAADARVQLNALLFPSQQPVRRREADRVVN